jgi:dUTPase
MTNLNQCSINFKKRPLAQVLENKTGISWSFRQENIFDVHVCLKLCVPNKAIIPKLGCKPVPTGISPQLLNPNYKMVITTNSLLAYEKGCIVLDSPAILDYTFRGEIWVMLFNTTRQDVVLRYGHEIANFTLEPVTKMNIGYVGDVVKPPTSTAKVKWVRKHIESINPKGNFQNQLDQKKFSKEEIKNYLKNKKF